MSKTSIDKAIMKLNTLDDVIKATCDESGRKIAEVLAGDITERYSDFISSLGDDHQDRSDTTISIQRLSDGHYRVDVAGNQVIYDEFGTGLPGKLHPHPEKELSEYGLNPYLSGTEIRYDKKGLPFWMYQDHSSDKLIFTRGVPSGQFVYRSYMEMEDSKANLLTSEELLKNIKKWDK